MHYWSLDKLNDSVTILGVVTGHPKFTDSTRIFDSSVISTEVDAEKEELIVTTREAVFRCPMAYCMFCRQDETPDLIENYEELKEKYLGKMYYPEIEEGKVLLVLSDFNEYYFHSLYVKDKDGEPQWYCSSVNTGLSQDSYTIENEYNTIDLRYYPHFRNILFYCTCTDDMPLYAENIGYNAIFVKYKGMYFCIKPNERKELISENAEKEKIENLPDGDLYPLRT